MGVESLLPQSTKRWEPNQKTKQEPMGHHHFVNICLLFDIDIIIVIAIDIVIVIAIVIIIIAYHIG